MDIDQAAVLAVPWLRDSVLPTGRKWGERIVDCKISRLPQHLLSQVLLVPESSQEVLLVIYRWDRHEHLGWPDPFAVVLTFPDGSNYDVIVPPSVKLDDYHSLRVTMRPETEVRERIKQSGRVIPRIFFNLSAPLIKQTAPEIQRLLKNVRKTTQLIQCTSLYLVIEDEAGYKEVESSGIPNFLEAYCALRSGSYKADLLRYYLLYKYGGIYADSKSTIRYSFDSDFFDSIFIKQDTNTPCDAFIGSLKRLKGLPEISFMGARRGSPLMLRALESSISNIMKRAYTHHRLGITGNIMFNKMIDYGPLSEESQSLKWLPQDGGLIAFVSIERSDERIVIDNDILWQRQSIPNADWPKSSTYYADLWSQDTVYVDDPEPRPASLRISAQAKREIIAYTLTVIGLMIFAFIITRYPPIQWI